MKNSSRSCIFKLSIMTPVSRLLGTWSCMLDQQAREKGHWNRRWARSSSTFRLQRMQL
jgi:hypothetical protein